MASSQAPWVRAVSFVFFLLLTLPIDALPAKKGADGKASPAGGITTATDGSTILDKTVTINGLPMRYKISGPKAAFTSTSGVPGAGGAANSTGASGLNVLLHGDGGDSFFAFPNQGMQNNLMGVAILAPNTEMYWGGGSGLDRTDGAAHAAAIDKLIKTQIPNDVSYDPTNVYFTGVSGGSLLMSGFFLPAYGASYKTGAVMNCGGMPPQVPVVDAKNLVNMKLHWQTTQDELNSLQGQRAIPGAIKAYENLATDNGLSPQDIGALQTVDGTPIGGGHCAFDGKSYTTGIQMFMNSYSNVMGKSATGMVKGMGANVLKTVVGNENVKFVKGKN